MPAVPVVANVTGEPYTSVDEIRAGLSRQVVEPVLWQQCVEHILCNTTNRKTNNRSNAVRAHSDAEAGGTGGGGGGGKAPMPVLPELYDMGPQSQIKAMVRKIDSTASCTSVDV